MLEQISSLAVYFFFVCVLFRTLQFKIYDDA